jgi:spore photoproduct lyase
MSSHPKRFLAERRLHDLPQGRALREKYPQLEWIDDYKEIRFASLRAEKEAVIFARKRGSWLKPFHCYHQNPEFSFYSLDVAEGCLFDCVYCYLQSYLNQGSLVLFVDCGNLQEEFQRCSGRNLWISTGLLSDSILAEKYFSLLPLLTRQLPAGSLLDLRTKAEDVDVLDNAEISRDKLVVSWSINPPGIAAQYEFRAPSLEARLRAARKAMQLGFRIGWHLDPVFHFTGWQDAYRALFDQMKNIGEDQVAFLSVGLFRYMPDLGAAIRKRFPNHPVLSGEFFPDRDGKYHYLRAIRKEMYRVFEEWLEPWKKKVPIFWSMEPDDSLLPDGSKL